MRTERGDHTGTDDHAGAAGRRAGRDGLLTGLASYVCWGFFPLYFILLRGVHPVEVLAQRVLWASALLLGVVALSRGWRPVGRALADRRARNGLGLAALFIGAVWFFYGYGALTGRSVDVALGYFICPLITVVLAVLVQGERLRPAQWVSAAVGASAVVVVTLGHGRFPWISVVVGLAFALYSLAKSRVGRDVGALAGLTVETVMLVPLSLVLVGWLAATGRATFAVGGLDTTDLWLALSGPLTVLPLLLFALAAARLRLSTIGNLQYLNPALQPRGGGARAAGGHAAGAVGRVRARVGGPGHPRGRRRPGPGGAGAAGGGAARAGTPPGGRRHGGRYLSTSIARLTQTWRTSMPTFS